MIKIVALVFHFVLVCNHDMYGCTRFPYGTRFDGWVDRGPYFTLEDCNEAREADDWVKIGISECYANVITWKGEQS